MTRESELHRNAPSIAGVIENAASTELRFMGSLNVTMIQGVRFVFDPTGRESVTNGAKTSTSVHVSFVAGAASTFPARSRAIERNWYVWPSGPVNDPEVVAAVATSQSVQPAPLSFT